ncbi:hypothetical protein [Amycolatopsis magusensis]|uniref:hypothetical protein n=1 Tax=Amycolatopsis magusensis TaxID=882444 RepID=UPI0024A8A2C8|nr:hypothetical protein [Amycolatopsis magusensis]MDI5978227.1 hypothetical protein [Amycolatopsis magusensis]
MTACAQGIVAKRRDAPYTPGRRTDAWLKHPLIQTQEVLVCGWRSGQRGFAGTLGSPHEAMARGNLAITLYELRQRGDAIDVFLAARTAFEQVGDRRSAAQASRNLGVVFRAAGLLADTVQAFVTAAVTYAKIGDRRAEVQVWQELERIYTAAGRPDDAHSAAERAAPAPGTADRDEPIQGLLGWRLRPGFDDEPTP